MVSRGLGNGLTEQRAVLHCHMEQHIRFQSFDYEPNMHPSKSITIGATMRVSDVDTGNKSPPASLTGKSPRRMARVLGF